MHWPIMPVLYLVEKEVERESAKRQDQMQPSVETDGSTTERCGERTERANLRGARCMAMDGRG